MLDVKAWLETTGYKVAEIAFTKKTPLPYIIFTDKRNVGGGDLQNNLVVREISVELYSDKINRDVEKAIEDLFDAKAVSYEKNRVWIGGADNFFETTYDFSITEKI